MMMVRSRPSSAVACAARRYTASVAAATLLTSLQRTAVPPDVWGAYEGLVAAGYDANVVPDAS